MLALSFFKRLLTSSSCWDAESEAILLIKRINYFLSNNLLESRILLPVHAYSIITGHSQNKFLASKLIESYAFIHQQVNSTKVFVSIDVKDVFLWNTIVKTHFSTGKYDETIDFFTKMRISGIFPNKFTLPMVFSACAELGYIHFGMCVHSLMSKVNLFHDNTAVGASLVYMYSKCGSLESASLVFDEIPVKDAVAWTALIIGYVQNGENVKGLECFREMHRICDDDRSLNFRTMEGGLQACGNSNMLAEGRCLHSLSLKYGFLSSHVVQSATLSLYSKCGDIEDARLSFNEAVNKDLYSWTSIIKVYARIGCTKECFQLYLSMLSSGLKPDLLLISCMVTGFSNSMNIFEGKSFHCYIIRRNYFEDNIVGTSLLSMYLKFGLLAFAESVFFLIKNQDTESWNLMIIGYGKLGFEINSLNLFRQQQYHVAKSNTNSLISIISSCAKLGAILFGRSVHGYIFRSMCFQNVLLVNSLITMYGKCGYLPLAERLFRRSTDDIASWNSLISCYVDNGHPMKALSLFDAMVFQGLKPTTPTLVTVLSACAHLASAKEGKKVHHYIKEEGLHCDVTLNTSLVDMYAKCGEIDMAIETFNMMKEKDVVSWNVMISCLAMHGDGKLAIEIFHEMEEDKACPNSLTFLAILSACVHSGLVDESKSIFAKMTKKYSIEPSMKHYTCMVDLYGRYGLVEEAEALISSMPFAPDGGVWGSLLSSCKMHNNVYMGMKIARRAIETDPENDGYYILLCEFYSTLEMWDEVEQMRQILKDKGLKRTVGWSSV